MATKLINVELDYIFDTTYQNDTPFMAACSKPNKFHVKTLTSVLTCREQFSEEIRDYIQWKDEELDWRNNDWEDSEIPLDKTRVLLFFNKGLNSRKDINEFQKEKTKDIRSGVRILNMLEDRAGWTRTAVKPATIVKCPTTGPSITPSVANSRTVSFYIIGSNKWITSPYLLSMWLLILRAGNYSVFQKVKTVQELIKVLRKYNKKYIKLMNHGDDKENDDPLFDETDSGLILQSFELWPILTKHYKKFFGNRTMLSNYDVTDQFSGINELTRGEARDTKLKTELDTFLKNRKLKIKKIWNE